MNQYNAGAEKNFSHFKSYLREKAWIERRIRENRERYAEELLYQFESTDALDGRQSEEDGEVAEA
jgi:hypothetical protein